MDVKIYQVRLEIKDPKVAKSMEAIISSVKGFRIQRSGENIPFDLLIFELGADLEGDFKKIRTLMDYSATGDIFLTSASKDESLLLRAIRTGAKEFFTHPIHPDEVRQSLERFIKGKERLADKRQKTKGTIINILGSKGGVGTTTVAVNMAVGLVEKKNIVRVALIDLNSLLGEIPYFLEIKPSYHWGEITKNISRLDETFLKHILVKHASGIHVLPSPNSLNGHGQTSPEIMERLLTVMRENFEFVVIDCGHSVDAATLKSIQMSDNLLMVSILSLPCLFNTNNLLRSLINDRHLSEERIGVIINRYLKKSEISIQDAEECINKKIFWTIPNDYRTAISAINQGKPLSQVKSKAPITKNINELVDRLIQKEESITKKKWGFLKGKGKSEK